MQLYHRLPAPDHSWTTTSVNTLKCLRGPNQNLLKQVVIARVELVRLAVFTAVELAIHMAIAGLKFTAIVIAPRVAVIDARAHAARSAKLAAALFVAPVVGLARPEWSISLYQKLSLVKQTDGRFASLRRLGADLLACSALIATGVAIRSRFFATQPQSWFCILLWAGLAGAGAMVVATLCVIRPAKIRCVPQLRESTVKYEHHHFKEHGPVYKMGHHENLYMFALQGSDDSNRTLRAWNALDQNIETCKARDFVVRQGVPYTTAVGVRTTFVTVLSDGNTAYGMEEGYVRIEISDTQFYDVPGVEREQPSAMARRGLCDAVATTNGHNSTLRIMGQRSEISRIIVTGSKVSVLKFCPFNRQAVALNGPDGAVGVWMYPKPGEDNDPVLMFQYATTEGTTVTAIEWLTDDRLFTGDNNGTLCVWDIAERKLLGVRKDHQGLIYNIEIQEDAVLTYSHDGQVRSWFGPR